MTDAEFFDLHARPTLRSRLIARLDRSRSIPSHRVTLVTGFWRSGTTWVQEGLARALRARTVFEPLHPCARLRPRPRWLTGWMISTTDRVVERMECALRGIAQTPWEQQLRAGIADSLYPAAVVKDVLAHHALGALRERHPAVEFLHVRRDPRDVIESMLALPWGRMYAAQLRWPGETLHGALVKRWVRDEQAIDRAGVDVLLYERMRDDPRLTGPLSATANPHPTPSIGDVQRHEIRKLVRELGGPWEDAWDTP